MINDLLRERERGGGKRHANIRNGGKSLLENHSREVEVPEVDLMYHSNPKDHGHKEDPQEEAPAVVVSSPAEFTKILPIRQLYHHVNRITKVKVTHTDIGMCTETIYYIYN